MKCLPRSIITTFHKKKIEALSFYRPLPRFQNFCLCFHPPDSYSYLTNIISIYTTYILTMCLCAMDILIAPEESNIYYEWGPLKTEKRSKSPDLSESYYRGDLKRFIFRTQKTRWGSKIESHQDQWVKIITHMTLRTAIFSQIVIEETLL